MVGWAIQDLVHMLLGDMITGVTLLVLMAVSAALMVGVRRQNLLDGLTRTAGRPAAGGAKPEAGQIPRPCPARARR